jgi:hypothetical protein
MSASEAFYNNIVNVAMLAIIPPIVLSGILSSLNIAIIVNSLHLHTT